MVTLSSGSTEGMEPKHNGDDVTDYYRETLWDYRALWSNSENLALHFGYHDETTNGHADALLNTNRVLAERAGVREGSLILDAGCGLGGSGLWLARNRKARVVGITLLRDHAAQARRLAETRAAGNRLDFVQADYLASPFASDSFDAVWALESVCHATEKARFYREAARVLKPGGRLVVADFMRVENGAGNGGPRVFRQWLDGWAIPGLDTADEHSAHASAAGFADTVVEDFTERVRPSLLRLYRLARVSYPFAVTGRFLKLRSAVQHANVVGAVRQYQALEQGYWHYGILSAEKPA